MDPNPTSPPSNETTTDLTTTTTTNHQQHVATLHTPPQTPTTPTPNPTFSFPDRVPNEIRNLVLDFVGDARFGRPDMAFRIVVAQGYNALEPKVPDRFMEGATQQPVPPELPCCSGIMRSEAHARVLAHSMAQVDRAARDQVMGDAASCPIMFSFAFAPFELRDGVDGHDHDHDHNQDHLQNCNYRYGVCHDHDHDRCHDGQENLALLTKLMQAPPLVRAPIRAVFGCAQSTVLIDYTAITNRDSIFHAIEHLLAQPTEFRHAGKSAGAPQPTAVPGALGEFRMRRLMLHHAVDLGNVVAGRDRSYHSHHQHHHHHHHHYNYHIGSSESESALLLDRLDHDGSFTSRGLRPDGWVVGDWHQLDEWMGRRRAPGRIATFAEDDAAAITLADGTGLVEWARVSRRAPFELAVLDVVDGSQVTWPAFVMLAFGFLRWRLHVLAPFGGQRQRTRGVWDGSWESVSLMARAERVVASGASGESGAGDEEKEQPSVWFDV